MAHETAVIIDAQVDVTELSDVALNNCHPIRRTVYELANN